VGACYYNAWYLSRALRQLGWRADVLTYPADDPDAHSHGWDYRLRYGGWRNRFARLNVITRAATRYDILHFSGKENIRLLSHLSARLSSRVPVGADIRLLKRLGRKVVYTNTGCLDGVSQTAFGKWAPYRVCTDCPWLHRPDICSDDRNLAWGKLRNELSDLVVIVGGNRVDYNDAPVAREVPEFYCLDPEVWSPDIEIPDKFRLDLPPGMVKIYHAVGNYDSRTHGPSQRNIKSTHIYVPIVERLKAEGLPVEWVFVKDVPNRDVRFYQVQADIVVDMLTYGFFGANVREALMLGKPAVCFLRPEWLEQMRAEIPEYVDQLPVVSATPETVYDVLKELVQNPEKRREIGRRSREFAVRFHSGTAAAKRFDSIYSEMIGKARRVEVEVPQS
jgi:glycosyltransferase involved in cell wall biosynthesis